MSKEVGSVGIASCYKLDGRSAILLKDNRFFSPPQRPEQLWVPHSFLPMRIDRIDGSLPPELNRLGHQADLSHPSISEVKNSGAISLLPIRLNTLVIN
jgi:hypothetical protein